MGRTSIIRHQFSRLRLYLAILLFVALLAQLAVFVGLIQRTWDEPPDQWLPELVIASLFLIISVLLALLISHLIQRRLAKETQEASDREFRHLRAAAAQIKAIQGMTLAMGATKRADEVMESALATCIGIMGDLGIPEEGRRGAIYLLRENELVASASHRLIDRDFDRRLPGDEGILGKVLEAAEPAASQAPAEDAELGQVAAFRESQTALCIPIRGEYHLYGVIVLGSSLSFNYRQEEVDLFQVIADQSVVALGNAELYHELAEDKRQIIAAGEDTRKTMSRSLYEGPKQNVDSIAMRLSFIRSTVVQQPEGAELELRKLEALARKTSKDLQRILSALRPVEMQAEGLSPSIAALADKLRQTSGLKVRFNGLEHGKLLNPEAQAVAFYVVEEAVASAQKHARPSAIDVNLWPEGKWFMARVADNGTGRGLTTDDQTQSPEWLNLTNMRQRARQVDGTLEVTTEPGLGSTVTLAIPLGKHGRTVSQAA